VACEPEPWQVIFVVVTPEGEVLEDPEELDRDPRYPSP
jgi:hypothetical protein